MAVPGRPNLHDTKTDCVCDKPLLNDERVLGMGVNCFKCGRSAEHLLTPEQRRDLKAYNRAEGRKRAAQRLTSMIGP